MASGNFFLIFIDRSKTSTLEQIEKVMNLAVDWYRIRPELWVLYTTSDQEEWYARLSPLVKPDGYIFICKLDTSQRQGWMKKDFWSWLRREKK